jgi:pimeloyl-[acyl-carrier protein] synthase
MDSTLSLSNLLRPEVRANPYPLYHELRSDDPVHWDESMGFWAVTRYSDIVSILHDTRFSKAHGLESALQRFPAEQQEHARPVYRVFAQMMLYADPPHHTRLRGLVNKAFTPRVVERMRPHVEQIVSQLLDEALARGRMDLIRAFAYPLPATVIMEMLDLPLAERDQFKHWSDDFMSLIGLVRHDPAQVAQARRSVSEVTDYLCDLFEQRRLHPSDDLLCALVNAGESNDSLDRSELVANTVLLLAAGHETTTNLIGNGMLALLRHPAQLQLLRDNPALIGTAVEELLRYDNPVQIVWRMPLEDVELDGRHIARGQIVNLLIGAANRDPAQFPDPDRLDLTGRENRHLGFGRGIHFCMGSPLARLEGQLAIGALLRRLPGLRLESEQLTWHENPTFRGLHSLPVTW